MTDITVLQDRPWLTGLLLGLVLYLSGIVADAGVGSVALLLFAVGVVVAIWGEDWVRPAGQALAGSGAVVVVLVAVTNLLRGLR
jgi:hypothetical protein